MKYDDLIAQLLSQDGVIVGRDHPELENALVRAASAGRLVRPLPGIFADPGNADDFMTKIVALSRWDPDAVICGRAAAKLGYWDDLDTVGTIQVASPTRHRPRTGFEFQRREVPAELVQRRGPLAFTTAALTAIELSTFDDTDAIDTALRKRVVTLESLQDALRQTANRRGNAERWRVLLDSRADPWSRAERLTHRLYRSEGITGWVGNLKTVVPDWGTVYLDIGFRRRRLAIEIDGREVHDTGDAFEADRERRNALVLAGWMVLNFTWRMVTDDPDYVVWATRAALAIADGRVPPVRQLECDTPWLIA